MGALTDMAREACITDPALLWAIIGGNLGIFVAYIWIPVSVMRILSSQSAVPQPVLWMLTASFILSCACTHAVAVIVIFRPYYGLESGTLVVTALISLFAAGVLHGRVGVVRKELRAYQALMERARTLQIDLDRALAGRVALPPSDPPAQGK